MREAVSDIIAERSQGAEGISRMVVLSLLVHAAFLTVIALKPDFWSGRHQAEAEPMMISLGGAEGPEAGGFNPLSARPVQEVAAPDTRPRAEPQPAPEAAGDDGAGTGREDNAETFEANREAGGENVFEETNDRSRSEERIRRGGDGIDSAGAVWRPEHERRRDRRCARRRAELLLSGLPGHGRAADQAQLGDRTRAASGKNTVKFVVQRDGRVTDIEVEESAGQLLDIASRRALVVTNAVAPLPREFAGDKLTIHLVFEYTR